MAEVCSCPLFDDGDPYMAGFLIDSLGVDRELCPGGQENELGTVVCHALIARQEASAEMMRPIGDAAEEFLRKETDGVE